MKIRIIAFSTNGCILAQKLLDVCRKHDVEAVAKTASDRAGIRALEGSVRNWTKEGFETADALIFIGATGIAVRHIAPFIKSKDVDPAVLSIDEKGRFVIPLLSGHIGGANMIANILSLSIGAISVVTTASDINGKIAIDVFAVNNNLTITSFHNAKMVEARILAGDPVGLVSDVLMKGEVPSELSGPADSPVGVYIGSKELTPFPLTLKLVPRDLVLGIGCRKGTHLSDIECMFGKAIEKIGASIDRIRAIASIDIKSEEPGLLEFASLHRLPITFYSAEQLNSVEGEFSWSGFVNSVTGVDCVCERSAVKLSDGGQLVLRKFAGDGVTIAVAKEEFSIDFSR